MDPLYRPQGVEQRWQQTWEEEGLYAADAASDKPPYVIAVPPPNVTGALHMGHALNGSIQDALIRWHRMRGFNALWQPGYDHAGIATQAVVEKELRKQGTSRFDLGREAFVERVWEWLHEYGGVIMGQFRRLGCSLDYDRERFTMDDAYVRAVTRFFVHLYERGWLYRDNRIVNWCSDCRTSISDLEVEHIEVDDALTFARYPFADGDGSITIATVRPATILADVAVAVHPEDERYRDAIGREVVVPVVGRRVPVIGDERVERDFGTGALKVTPGHDPLDFEIGRDHGLPEPAVIGLDGLMTGDIPDLLIGLTEDEAADYVIEWLREEGLLEKRESYRHSVGHCERSGTRIQPLVSLQWWCAMEELARPAIEAIESGRVTFHPPTQNDVALRWLRSIRSWNVSRQLWWGHQLPVWYCPDGHVTCSETEPAACGECGSAELRRDEDVLDTWFSSALWPFATLGWPDETPELRTFYPGERELDGARDHLPLGAPHGDVRPRADGRHPLRGRDHPHDDPGSRRTADVQVARHRHRPPRADRRTRRRCDSLRPAEDVVDAGRSLLGPADRGGAEARQQALERKPAAAHGRRCGARGAAQLGRGTLDPRADRRDARRARDRPRGLRLRARGREALPPHVRRLLRLVSRGDQAAARRGGRARDGVRGAGAAAQAPPPGDAARDGGDLDEPAGPPVAAHRR